MRSVCLIWKDKGRSLDHIYAAAVRTLRADALASAVAGTGK
jgi:hypothetical protein